MDNYSKAVLRKKINRLAKRGVLRDKNIVLFGASAFSREIKNCLLEQGFMISGVVDNDKRKIDTACMGLRVQKPEEALLPRRSDTVILMLSAGFYREMAFQITQMGYAKGRDFFILNYKADETIPSMAYFIARVIRGRYTYKRHIKGAAPHKTVFIAPYTGIGDIYLVGLFFNEYLRRNGIEDYVFVVVSGACKKVAEIFDIENVIFLQPRIADDIINARDFLRADWPVVILNDGWMGEPSQWIRGYKGLDFEKVFRYFVFGFKKSVPHTLPPVKDLGAQVDAVFAEHGLVKGKTVVLSPYSNTLFDLPDGFWQGIVRRCNELGLTACTNCAGKTEKPVAGTQAVFFPLGQAVEFLNAAGCFIGVRSGLCDVISASACKKIVLYEKEGFFYRCSPFEYFSLDKMGLCKDAVELEHSADEGEAVLSRVLGELELFAAQGGNEDGIRYTASL